jgi:hypothetical protein
LSSTSQARLVALVLAGALSVHGAAVSSEPTEPMPGPVCIETGLTGGGLDDLIRDAVAVLRQSGRDPAQFRMELRIERAGLAELGSQAGPSYPSVVFHPSTGSGRYPVRVDRTEPCAVSWVWQPERFTVWQRRVIERAGEVLRRNWTREAGESLSGVQVVETKDEVTVRLRLGEPDASGLVPSRAEVTLRRSDLTPID